MILYLVTLVPRSDEALGFRSLQSCPARSSIGRTPHSECGKLGSIPRRATKMDDSIVLGHVAQLDRAVVSGTAGWGSSPHVATNGNANYIYEYLKVFRWNINL